MATLEFDFKAQNAWTMGPACRGIGIGSTNPAPVTTGCIYIIHNTTENTTYVGYADSAYDRWKARTEVFHIMGIPQAYGQNILCAYCYPVHSGTTPVLLQGQNACEHLLIRAVVKGLLGVTTNTNSQLANTPFINSNVTQVRVYLPSDPWGSLEGRKQANVGFAY